VSITRDSKKTLSNVCVTKVDCDFARKIISGKSGKGYVTTVVSETRTLAPWKWALDVTIRLAD
jgi:hypothetical protein